uniref:Uncharacterized protein n=1 Tax=Myotis myotis TaxID=51298 RepID=A0A7J7SCT4_MYOMY|nr:hypothetical protein mMyoMyo1_009514 [Myotis myotis]
MSVVGKTTLTLFVQVSSLQLQDCRRRRGLFSQVRTPAAPFFGRKRSGTLRQGHPGLLEAGLRLSGRCGWSRRDSEVSLVRRPKEGILVLRAWSRYVLGLEPGTGIFRVALYGLFGRIEGAAQGIMGQ